MDEKRLVDGATAVSYTHLDVYKRQLMESLRRMQVAADLLTDEMEVLPSEDAQAPAADL